MNDKKISKLEMKVLQALSNKQYRATRSVCKSLLKIDRNNFEAFFALGMCEYYAGSFGAAAEFFSKAFAIKSDSFKLCLNISNLYQEVGDFDKALAMLERCVTINPKSHMAYNNMGNVLRRIGADPGVILAHYDMSLKLKPDYSQAYVNAASVYIDHGNFEKALELVEQGLEKDRSNLALVSSYTQLVNKLGTDDEKEKALLRLLDIDQQSALSLVQLLGMAKSRCDWDKVEEYRLRLDEYFDGKYKDQVKVNTAETLSNYVGPFQLLSCDLGLDKVKQATEHYVDVRQRGVFPKDKQYPVVADKVKVGYVSPDFNVHPVGLLIRDLFKYHDRNRYEIYCYYLRGTDRVDNVTKEIAASSDHFKIVGGAQYVDICKQISADGIHILLDLSGYTDGAYPQIFDARPAPIQGHFLGYPGTLGSKCVDYYLTTRDYTPDSLTDYFTEEIVYLPDVIIATKSFEYGEPLPSREQVGLPADKFVFYCFSALYRIDKKTVDAWIAVLKQAKESVLWLMKYNAAAEDKLRSYIEEAGIESNRIIFSEPEAHTRRGIHRLGDVLLDALTLTSGTAAIFALSDGVPIVSMAGSTPQSRTCLAQLAGVGMDHLVAESTDDFIKLAVKMANDPVFFKQQKSMLDTNLKTAALFDQPRYVKNIERAFEEMVKKYEKNDPVSRIDLS